MNGTRACMIGKRQIINGVKNKINTADYVTQCAFLSLSTRIRPRNMHVIQDDELP